MTAKDNSKWSCWCSHGFLQLYDHVLYQCTIWRFYEPNTLDFWVHNMNILEIGIIGYRFLLPVITLLRNGFVVIPKHKSRKAVPSVLLLSWFYPIIYGMAQDWSCTLCFLIYSCIIWFLTHQIASTNLGAPPPKIATVRKTSIFVPLPSTCIWPNNHMPWKIWLCNQYSNTWRVHIEYLLHYSHQTSNYPKVHYDRQTIIQDKYLFNSSSFI